MPTLYHFGADGYKEELVLDRVRQHMVPGRLCQYLKSWQLDGIRYLYKHVMGGESCILNDESGLGKTVTVAVFLGAILGSDPGKKCLIVVRDEDYIEGWRFHLSILTDLNVKVIGKTSDIDYETVFLIKWSILKDIDQTNFDYIVVDNRGDMLTNKFCTGILLRYYENKISIVISSTDVTADIKLLHILLRLCGREHTDLKNFEEKFQMPTLKDGVITKADMEEYFVRREKVINFCREFRLRRYRHQFEEEFPLVPSVEFKRHLEHWRNNDFSQSSGSVKLLSSSSEKDTEELFKTYFQVKEEDHTKQQLDNEVQQIIERMTANDESESDEVIVMSPLLFVDSESDSEKEPESKARNEMEISETNKPPAKKKKDSHRGKAEQPLKKLAQTRGAMLLDKCLRSQKDSPLHAGLKTRKSVVQKTTSVEDAKSPTRRGRKAMVKVQKNEETDKRLKDDQKTHQRTTDPTTVRKELTEVQIPDMSEEIPETPLIIQTQPKTKDPKPLQTTTTESTTNKTKANEDKSSKAEKNHEDIDESMKTSDRRKQKQPRKNEENTRRVGRPARNQNQTKEKHNEKLRTEDLPIKNKSDLADKNGNKFRIRRRNVQLNAVLLEANKFLNNKHNTKKDKKERRALMRNRSVDESVKDKSSSLSIRLTRKNGITNSVDKSPKPTKMLDVAPRKDKSPSKTATKKPERERPLKRAKYIKDEEYLPRSGHNHKWSHKTSRTLRSQRAKPLTVFSAVGLHSRSTRGMERNTRSCQVQNKYMKIAFAQVGLNRKSKVKQDRSPRRQSVFVRGKPTRSPPPPLPPSPPVIEESVATESMQLGQALSPSNCLPETDFVVPPPRNHDYDFPLMLDKIIPESECLPVIENNNEVIVLTGSSTNDNEPRPFIAPYFRPTMRPPMVTIPRPAYIKAKSPDLFSSFGDHSLPCSQQKTNTNFEGFKIFGSELRQSSKSSSDAIHLSDKNEISLRDTSTSSPHPHCIDDEDAMFEITSNGTFGNMLRVNSTGNLSPVHNKIQSPTQATPHTKNRITNYLVGNTNTNGTSSPEDTNTTDHLPKTPKRRKSVSGTLKRSPRTLSGGKSQRTKLTQWLVKNSIVRISDSLMKPQTTKRRRLDLSFPDK